MRKIIIAGGVLCIYMKLCVHIHIPDNKAYDCINTPEDVDAPVGNLTMCKKDITTSPVGLWAHVLMLLLYLS